jgi:pimeloyl-ACP methyl ester carboxylesterase
MTRRIAEEFKPDYKYANNALVRFALRVTESISTELAAQLVFKVVCRPPRLRASREAARVMLHAISESVNFAGQNIHVYRWGKGPIVLCVHGWGGSAAQMSALVPPLVAAGYQVVAFDAPGHGSSDGRSTDPIEFARALYAVTEKLGPVAAIIGHSMGAAVSLLAMRDWGVRAERIVMISAFTTFDFVRDSLRQAYALGDVVFKRVVEKFFSRYSDRFCESHLSPLHVLPAVRCPALILHDQDDEICPIRHAEELVDASRGTRFVRTQGFGHYEIVNETVARWCADFVTGRHAFAPENERVHGIRRTSSLAL